MPRAAPAPHLQPGAGDRLELRVEGLQRGGGLLAELLGVALQPGSRRTQRLELLGGAEGGRRPQKRGNRDSVSAQRGRGETVPEKTVLDRARGRCGGWSRCC